MDAPPILAHGGRGQPAGVAVEKVLEGRLHVDPPDVLLLRGGQVLQHLHRRHPPPLGRRRVYQPFRDDELDEPREGGAGIIGLSSHHGSRIRIHPIYWSRVGRQAFVDRCRQTKRGPGPVWTAVHKSNACTCPAERPTTPSNASKRRRMRRCLDAGRFKRASNERQRRSAGGQTAMAAGSTLNRTGELGSPCGYGHTPYVPRSCPDAAKVRTTGGQGSGWRRGGEAAWMGGWPESALMAVRHNRSAAAARVRETQVQKRCARAWAGTRRALRFGPHGRSTSSTLAARPPTSGAHPAPRLSAGPGAAELTRFALCYPRSPKEIGCPRVWLPWS